MKEVFHNLHAPAASDSVPGQKYVYVAIFRDICRAESIICCFIELWKNKPANKWNNLDDFRLVDVVRCPLDSENCLDFEKNNAFGFSHQTLKTYQAAETNMKFQF